MFARDSDGKVNGIARETANTDLVCGVVFLVLAAADRWAHFDLVVAWSILTAALLAPRHRVLAEPMRVLGSIVACLALGLLLLDDFYIFTLGIYPALIVGAAVASARTRLFGWAGVAIASVGIAGHIAVLLDAEPWSTLLLFEPQQAILPSARLVAGGTLAVLIGAFAYWRRNRNVVNAACAYAAVLAGAELLLHIDGIGTVPLGLAAAGVLWALPSRFRSIWPVSVALLLAQI